MDLDGRVVIVDLDGRVVIVRMNQNHDSRHYTTFTKKIYPEFRL